MAAQEKAAGMLGTSATAHTTDRTTNSTAQKIGNSAHQLDSPGVLRNFVAAMEARNIIAPSNIVADGSIHRCDVEGKNGKNDASYCLHLDGWPAGGFRNWCDGLDWENWSAERAHPLTPAERRALTAHAQAMKRQQEAEKRRRHAEVAALAAKRWAAAAPADDSHPYLQRKGVRAHGLRIDAAGNLLVPMRDTAGHLHNLQSIAPDGSKRFMPGGRVKGCYFGIGRPSDKLVICEGYATGASIHEDTGHAVAVAFCASNLMDVAKALRAKFPCLKLIMAADDDWETLGNPGLAAARAAAAAVGGLLMVPDFTGLPRGDKDTDWNDWARLRREALAMEVSA